MNNISSNVKGSYFLFEGLDWSGKDTQLNNSFKYILSEDKYAHIMRMREPSNRTNSGNEVIRRLTTREGFKDGNEAMQLYISDRAELNPLRKILLENWTIILWARGDLSTYAYQMAQWMSFDDVYNMHKKFNIIDPTVTLFFDVNIENIEKRLNKRDWDKREYFERLDFLAIAREKYLEAIKLLIEKDNRNICIIDANNNVEETFNNLKIVLDTSLNFNK